MPDTVTRTKRPLYREIASRLQARLNCIGANNGEWEHKHNCWLLDAVKNGPSGAGIDCGTKLDIDASTPEKLVFDVSFHHMNDVGMYDGWTEHVVTVRASLVSGIDIRISGRDRNEIKDYLHEVYHYWLTQEVEIS